MNMENTQHTPGKWNYKRQGFNITIGNEDTGATKHGHDYTVAVIHDNSFQAEANARLIASAPEMLDALIEAKKLIAQVRQYMPKSIKNADRFHFENVSANVIEKAILKATKP